MFQFFFNKSYKTSFYIFTAYALNEFSKDEKKPEIKKFSLVAIL